VTTLAVPVRAPWRGRILGFVGIALVALSLRTAVGAVSPILDHISRDIPLSAIVISLLGAVPPIAFAVSGLLAPAISRRLGLDRTLLVAIGVMVLGHLGRALAPSAGVLLGSTVVTLVGVGVANVLLPPIVKRYFPDRIGLVSALYITVMSFGSSIPALIAVPVADSVGWRASLGIWFVVALTAAIPWIGMLRRERHERARAAEADDAAAGVLPEPEPALAARMAHSVVAWAMVGAFGGAAFVSYATFAWLPSILVDTAGLSRGEGGSLLALWAFMGFPCGILAPILATRLKNITPLLVAAVSFILIGYGGLLLAPAAAPVLWTVLAGLGPLLFPLTLALINLRTRSHVGAVTLSGFVQGLAYAIGALGPIVIGLIHGATGTWSLPLLVLVIVGVALATPAVFLLGRPRFVEDELAERAARATVVNWD
jgi:CP family cyanate transporter-like MFS transporter